jgi:hypothetical protein
VAILKRQSLNVSPKEAVYLTTYLPITTLIMLSLNLAQDINRKFHSKLIIASFADPSCP